MNNDIKKHNIDLSYPLIGISTQGPKMSPFHLISESLSVKHSLAKKKLFICFCWKWKIERAWTCSGACSTVVKDDLGLLLVRPCTYDSLLQLDDLKRGQERWKRSDKTKDKPSPQKDVLVQPLGHQGPKIGQVKFASTHCTVSDIIIKCYLPVNLTK